MFAAKVGSGEINILPQKIGKMFSRFHFACVAFAIHFDGDVSYICHDIPLKYVLEPV
jgi:hypothetical protein